MTTAKHVSLFVSLTNKSSQVKTLGVRMKRSVQASDGSEEGAQQGVGGRCDCESGRRRGPVCGYLDIVLKVFALDLGESCFELLKRHWDRRRNPRQGREREPKRYLP